MSYSGRAELSLSDAQFRHLAGTEFGPALVEGRIMKRAAVHYIMFASIVAGLVGCQTGPRWTWWKPWEKPSTETAVAANSTTAAPTLPSASAKPQAVAASGLQPAASPSSTNLATAGSKLATSTAGVQP